MKIYAFVDIHANAACAEKVVKRSRDADILLCAGDLSDFTQGLNKMARILSKAKKPMLMIHGNHESSVDVDNLARKYKYIANVHHKIYRVNGVVIAGFGGGGFSFEDKRMERFFRKAKSEIQDGDEVVMVTHAPAYGKNVDHIRGIGHRGCVSVNKGIKLLKPAYSVAGHLHETAGKTDHVGKTTILNPGCAGRMIEI